MQLAVENVSAKQSTGKHRRDWYPFYAGFTERFVDAVIDSFLTSTESVIDPWSGSGTTVVSCQRRGIISSGLDINPATTVIGRARLNPKSLKRCLLDTAGFLVEQARTRRSISSEHDLLRLWMTGEGVDEIRSIVASIRQFVDRTDEVGTAIDPLQAPGPSHRACFFYTACFAVVRSFLGRYDTTNPTWIRRPKRPQARIRPTTDSVRDRFLIEVERLADLLTLTEKQAHYQVSPLVTGLASDTGFPARSFDAAITSPPYATRIDYVQGSLPELGVLGASEEFVERLRSQSTGTPKVSGVRLPDAPVLSSIATNLLQVMKHHPSKGSQTYYYPWMANYLHSLQAGLHELDRVVKTEGTVCVVVQDSYYKETHVDLQGIVTEIFASLGRTLVARHNNPVRNARRRSCFPTPSRSLRAYSESLLVFRCLN